MRQSWPLVWKQFKYVIDFKEINRNGFTYATWLTKLTNPQRVIAMETSNEINQIYIDRFAFIEDLSREFVSMTGCGIYVFLNPSDVEQLFDQYQSLGMSMRMFAKQCVRNLH